MLAGTITRKLVQWRWRLGIAACTALLFALPAIGQNVPRQNQVLTGPVPGFFTPAQEAQLQAATNPRDTPQQVSFLNLLQWANEAYWLAHERLEIARFLRANPNAQGTALFRRYVRTERLERQFLFNALLALRQSSPFQIAFFLDADDGDLFEGGGF